MNIKIPKFMFRTIQAEMQEIVNRYRVTNDLQQALADYLQSYVNNLPDGKSVDAVIREMKAACVEFCAAQDRQFSVDELRRWLKAAVASMNRDSAFVFLATLEAACRASDLHWNEGGAMPSEGQFQAMIEGILHDPGERSLDQRIEDLAQLIVRDPLKMSIYAAGSDELRDLAASGELDLGASRAVAAELALRNISKSDTYLIGAVACYAQVLSGKVEGLAPEKARPEVIAVLMAAGFEKASIMTRILKGEIDKELGLELLQKVATVVKWILAKLLMAGPVIVGGMVAAACADFFGLCAVASAVVISLGTILGFALAVVSVNDYEKSIDELCEFLSEAAAAIGGWMKSVWQSISRPVANFVTSGVHA